MVVNICRSAAHSGASSRYSEKKVATEKALVVYSSRIEDLKTNGNDVKGKDLKGEKEFFGPSGTIIADKGADIVLQNSDDIEISRRKSDK